MLRASSSQAHINRNEPCFQCIYSLLYNENENKVKNCVNYKHDEFVCVCVLDIYENVASYEISIDILSFFHSFG